MNFRRRHCCVSCLRAFVILACGPILTADALESKTQLPEDFLNQIVKDEQSLRLTLPNGRQVVGKIGEIQRFSGGVARVQGTIQHPEPGEFSFERQHRDGEPGKLQGSLKFVSQATRWTIEPDADGVHFNMLEAPVEDAFRPRTMVMPTPENTRPRETMSRESAEAALRKDLKIEKISPGRLRIGLVDLDQENRSIRFPAVVNMTSGTVEYVVVTQTGKCHESLFSTTASPRDIHLSMLLLGIQPAKFAQNPDKGLIVPATAAVEISAGWQIDGSPKSCAVSELLTVAGLSSDKPAAEILTDRPWLYNGSRFNDAGFGAMLEGSIISLIGDDLALINNPRSDRDNDEIHIPNTGLLPPAGTAVTITLRRLPAPSPKSPGSKVP